MTNTFACDVSYYQPVVNNNYPHEWFIFRSNDGTFRDPNFAANLKWAKAAYASGKIKGYTVYYVFRPGVNSIAVHKSMVGTPGPGHTSMCDIESWGGQVRGNHSSAITAELNSLASWLGSNKRLLAYANQGDFANIYPTRPSWLRLVVAGYSSYKPSLKNMIGWQYSDGESKYAVPSGYPRSSKPFGNCDHNVFALSPTALAASLGVGDDEENPLADLTAAQLQQIAHAVWMSDNILPAGDGSKANPYWAAGSFIEYMYKLLEGMPKAVWTADVVPMDPDPKSTNPNWTPGSVMQNIRNHVLNAEASASAANTKADAIAAKVSTLATSVNTVLSAITAAPLGVLNRVAQVQAAIEALPSKLPSPVVAEAGEVANSVMSQLRDALSSVVK